MFIVIMPSVVILQTFIKLSEIKMNVIKQRILSVIMLSLVLFWVSQCRVNLSLHSLSLWSVLVKLRGLLLIVTPRRYTEWHYTVSLCCVMVANVTTLSVVKMNVIAPKKIGLLVSRHSLARLEHFFVGQMLLLRFRMILVGWIGWVVGFRRIFHQLRSVGQRRRLKISRIFLETMT